MSIRFGTDGIRGLANAELSVELVLALGRATARHLTSYRSSARAFLVGRDTRRSGPMLLAAISAGLVAEGADVVDVGVITTPGLAYLARVREFPAVMISASHNPFPDNGIKLLSSTGAKLDEATERAIEEELEALLSASSHSQGASPVGVGVGVMREDRDAWLTYAEHLHNLVALPETNALVVVCDCANGAACAIAPVVLARTGVTLRVINAEPDGTNINENCGSTHPEALVAEVLARGADLGLGFDGDADRLIAVDANGELVDGDALLALFAFDLAERGELGGNAIAITVMSNIGLRRALEARGITAVETAVGDKNVVDAIESLGLVLGGEQSGHIVFRRDATTGDGILSGLKLLELLARKGRPLAELAREAMTRFPQELRSVHVTDRSSLEQAEVIWAEVAKAQASLGGAGRVLIRASGTEEIVRIMVEAEQREHAVRIVERLSAAVRRELGAPAL